MIIKLCHDGSFLSEGWNIAIYKHMYDTTLLATQYYFIQSWNIHIRTKHTIAMLNSSIATVDSGYIAS